MTYHLIKLRFHTPLHIGTVKMDYATSEKMLHSDTLYAALMQVWSMLGWRLPDDPPFALSSLFPFTMSEGREVYFFPKSYLHRANTQQNREDLSKQIKKVQWLDKEKFEAFIQNRAQSISEAELQGEYLTANRINKDFIKTVVTPRAKISRTGLEDTQIYYIEKRYFEPDSGLYFLYECEDAEAERKLLAGLDLLQSEGIGTDRNVGFGKFTYEKAEMTLSVPTQTDFQLNLSLFLPEKPEQLESFLGEGISYELVKRGGYISQAEFSTYKKKNVYMFREGSVLRTGNTKRIQGGSIDLMPEIMQHQANKHPIWRCGKSIFVPIKV